ncbi:hypothetical protein EGR_10300 [Echinococcus granulosus]|uniref:Uncharacterized protein n=1 Tax=Echinococcus granulosus TaxID=6210 RepID=W6U147_ECHGR|nr:hypothetical protein EGR_10300 [Echinococcus granulosus]EUB54835.1 hypothetical protein EGR_10300 [Echinococcus granulosus]
MNTITFMLFIVCPRPCIVSWLKSSSLLTCTNEQAETGYACTVPSNALFTSSLSQALAPTPDPSNPCSLLPHFFHTFFLHLIPVPPVFALFVFSISYLVFFYIALNASGSRLDVRESSRANTKVSALKQENKGVLIASI